MNKFDTIFSANDGMITTFAIIAGSTGASLSANIVVILGLVNLLADGTSMASGNYLGVKSEVEYQKSKKGNHIHEYSPLKHGVVTFVSYFALKYSKSQCPSIPVPPRIRTFT